MKRIAVLCLCLVGLLAFAESAEAIGPRAAGIRRASLARGGRIGGLNRLGGLNGLNGLGGGFGGLNGFGNQFALEQLLLSQQQFVPNTNFLVLPSQNVNSSLILNSGASFGAVGFGGVGLGSGCSSGLGFGGLNGFGGNSLLGGGFGGRGEAIFRNGRFIRR